MGLQIILYIHQVDDLEFDDLAALNTELLDNTKPYGLFGELYDEIISEPGFVGPFKFDDGTFRIAQNWDGGFDGYSDSTMVWGCYGEALFKQIASHITAGKLVLFIEIEGNDNEYYILTPGNVEYKSAADLRF